MKPIQFPLAGVLWLWIVVFIIYHNWGWWRPDGTFSFWENFLFGTFGVVAGSGIAALVLGGAAYASAYALGRRAPCEWKPGWHGTLASLRNSDGVQGSLHGGIFLMSGHIGSTEVFYYYTTDGPDHYKPDKWYVDGDTTVIEEDRTDGDVQQFVTVFAQPWRAWIAIPNGRVRMDFRIPRGSLVHNYHLE